MSSTALENSEQLASWLCKQQKHAALNKQLRQLHRVYKESETELKGLTVQLLETNPILHNITDLLNELVLNTFKGTKFLPMDKNASCANLQANVLGVLQDLLPDMLGDLTRACTVELNNAEQPYVQWNYVWLAQHLEAFKPLIQTRRDEAHSEDQS